MGLTYTECIPEHYATAATSPSSIPDAARRKPFPFMRLPLEIRLQIYKDHFIDRYCPSPTEVHEMVLDPDYWTKSSPAILQVSKVVNAEVEDLLQHETTFNMRICWQDATFDGFAMSCFRAKGKRPDYDHIAHLRLEIYPPHPQRPIDMVQIWRHVQKLCSDLQEACCIPHLSIHFMENEYAGWDYDGTPQETMYASYTSDQIPSDILHILDLFKLLKNMGKVEIHLPESLIEDMSLQQLRQTTEDAMMKIKPMDDEHQKKVIETLEEKIAEQESYLKFFTGSRSQEKLDELCGYGHWISKPHYDIFEKIWPHRDCICEWDYKKGSEYIGNECFEGMPVEGSGIDPYDRETALRIELGMDPYEDF